MMRVTSRSMQRAMCSSHSTIPRCDASTTSRSLLRTAYRRHSTTPRYDAWELARYGEWAASYDERMRSWSYQAPPQVATLLASHCATPSDACILDVGCGTGLSGEAIHAAGFGTVAGVDSSVTAVDHLRHAKPRLYNELAVVDINSAPLPFMASAFDGVVCVGVLPYVSNHFAAFSEWARVTRQGGHVVFTHRDWLWVSHLDAC